MNRVYYIQQEYAGDPRQFYYGAKRPHAMQTQSTLNLKSYSRLVQNGRGALVDDRDLAKDKEETLTASSDLRDGGWRRGDEFGFAGEGGGFARGASAGIRAGVIAGRQMPAAASEEKTMRNQAHAQNAREFGRVSNKVAVMSDSAQEPPVQVRSDFRSTAFWQPDIVTGADGKAVVKLKYPDSVTTWKAVARAMSAGNQFGIGSGTTPCMYQKFAAVRQNSGCLWPTDRDRLNRERRDRQDRWLVRRAGPRMISQGASIILYFPPELLRSASRLIIS